jgi:cyclopropane-fatty-acyl-phospholipid synthase
MDQLLCTPPRVLMTAPRSDWLQRRARSAVLKWLQRLRQGEIRLCEADATHVFGECSDRYPLRATLRVHDPRFYLRLATGGSIAGGETYMDGLWSSDDLPALLQIVLHNRDIFAPMDGWKAWLANLGHRLWHLVHPNSRTGSRNNVAAHYDLGNSFYRLWLDDSLMYSCAIFEHDDMPLDEAALVKLDRICRKLDLRPCDHLLEIGAGWGGFAIHAAKHFGCRVTTTTISQEQYDFAATRIRDLELDDRIHVVRRDYRELDGQYDKLVSIEMIEAVGEAYLNDYFACCNRLLKPGGMMLLQAITLTDRFYAAYRRSVDFIQRYVFPGGFLPSASAIADRLARVTDLRLHHLEEFGAHYARTLRHWRERFLAQIEHVQALGYPERFVRMWEYYLAYCEAGFAERNTGLAQMLLVKPPLAV